MVLLDILDIGLSVCVKKDGFRWPKSNQILVSKDVRRIREERKPEKVEIYMEKQSLNSEMKR
jgi:hypothetical protein